ncbi:MAG: hypothetical protein J1F23_05425 [Oscillospiraceae bacterium]|nr:hypothetical protein [Oscillospiraceae bacterium]
MYSVDVTGAQLLIGYTDVFLGETPNLKEEITTLNMHKAISIICELIRVRDTMLSPFPILLGECRIPFETVLKKQMCDMDPKSSKEMFSNPLFRKDVHIISVQMLLLLLKRIIQYGNYETLNNTEYEVSQEDYRKIIQLQLVVAEEISHKHLKGEFDVNHFLYSTYHLNYQRNVAHEFLRMYYMMEKISMNRDKFGDDVQKQYRDYFTAFTTKYGFTPTQYSSLLFGELRTYYSDVNGLIYTSMWRDTEKVYGQIKEKELITQVIQMLSQSVEKYFDWATETEDQEWDFSKFFEFPFIVDKSGKYISVCDITLRNAFFEKIFWLIRNCYPEDDSRAMAFFGRLFEKYIQDVTQDATHGDYEYIAEFTYKPKKKEKKSSDAYVRKGENLLVVEAKGFSVLLDCMTKNEQIEKNNRKLFIDPVLQADICLSNVIADKSEFSGVEVAYIIAVTMDNINAVPNYYNEIHTNIEKEKVCEKTKYYFNFSIEEYEMLMYLLEQGNDIFALLSDYYDNERLKPFSNYLQENYSKIGMTSFMENLYQEATDKMKDMIF